MEKTPPLTNAERARKYREKWSIGRYAKKAVMSEAVNRMISSGEMPEEFVLRIQETCALIEEENKQKRIAKLLKQISLNEKRAEMAKTLLGKIGNYTEQVA